MYDIIIIGAGVAGCYLASKLQGFSVLIIEKDKKVFLKDSGLVSTGFDRFYDFDRKMPINKIDLYSPSGSTFSLMSEKIFLYALNRINFSKLQRKEAKENADMTFETALKITYHIDRVLVETDKSLYEAKMIVGCDGTNSVVKRSLGITTENACAGLMSFPKKRLKKENISVYFDKKFSNDFFAWIIPHHNEYGLMASENAVEGLRAFSDTFDIPCADIHGYQIPIGYNRSYWHRALLIGDSAGMTKPLTEGGIMFSLTACEYALAVIKKAFDKNKFDASFLSKYECIWKRDFGWEIRKQLVARNLYKKLNNMQIDHLFNTFGRHIEGINSFDYDKFSRVWVKMPKLELIKACLKVLL